MPFAPYNDLATRLLHSLGAHTDDGSHDLTHIQRVWRNAWSIAQTEPGADTELLLAAVILHDCVAVEKDSPLRAHASGLAAERARTLIAPFGWAAERIDALAHAIAAHSFSAGLKPETLEARILQDADRLDAIGAVGIARCFYVGGRMRSALYNAEDPAGDDRDLDDRNYALDHFKIKLFRIADGFQTRKGRAMAAQRSAYMREYVDTFVAEVTGGAVK